MDKEKIKKEVIHRLNIILEEIKQPEFSRLCSDHQVQVYNTLRFSIKEFYSIGTQHCDQVDGIVQSTLWPKADFDNYPLTL